MSKIFLYSIAVWTILIHSKLKKKLFIIIIQKLDTDYSNIGAFPRHTIPRHQRLKKDLKSYKNDSIESSGTIHHQRY